MRGSRLLVCLFLVLGVPSLAQIIHVPFDHPSIQAGINAAEPGDTILVAEGTYFENIDFVGKPLTLASHFLLDSDTSHINRTIIDGSRATDPTRASVVSLRSGEDSTSVLCGFTITGGTGSYLTDVHIEAFMRNWRNMCGGGVLMHHSGGKIIHNIIERNLLQTDTIRGAYGGGILANVNPGLTAIIRSNIIRHNTIRKRQGHGGGICLFGGNALLEHNVIIDNLIDVKYLSCGAAIFFQNDSSAVGAKQVAFRNNVIAWNRAMSSSDMGLGGGIGLCFGYVEDILEISHNIICENYTNGIGGAIYSISGQGLVYGNLIFDNIAEMYGSTLATEQKQRLVLGYNHLWAGPVWLATRGNLCKVQLNHEYDGGMNRYLEHRDPSFTDRFSVDPATGDLFIGERKRALSFSPLAVPLQTFAPPMVIIDYRQPGSTYSEPQDLQLDLSHRENFLNFKFSVLELAETDEYQYSSRGYEFRYFMEGVDRDTGMTGMELTARYRNLNPGNYKFWVARLVDPELWDQNTENMSFKLRIRPPWYRSSLVLGLYVLFLVLLITGITKYRTAKLKKDKLYLENEVARRTEELSEKNAQILEMQRLKTRFFTDISHEIRTPLALISGPLDQLVNQEYRDPKILRWLSLIRRNSRRLVRLVNQLLDISRLDAGYMKLVIEESDVTGHLRMLAGEYFSLAESKEIQYIIDIPEMRLLACYDGEKLEKICTNLLSNAFKFTPPGGTVTCRLKILNGTPDINAPLIRLMVADTGPGIPSRLREKIFDRFYRGEEESSPFSNGTGIGLSLTKELVRIMHGEIDMKSKVGVGTVFMVTFPTGCTHLKQEEFILKDPKDQLHDKSSGLVKNGGPLQEDKLENENVSILVVEDNKDLQAFLLENLAEEFNVHGSFDGKRGLSLATSQMPDLIITDVMMPGKIDGMELCRRIKDDERTSHIPVIILTAKSTGKDKISGLEHGADDYIIKPFSMEELLVRIRNLLKQRERLRKKYSSLIGVDWENIPVTTLDEKFLKNVLEIISEYMTDFGFNVSTLQEKMSMSREHIFRKLKALTGESPSSMIRVMRLKAAASIMEKGEINIAQVAMQVGFSNPSYFSQCFKAHFGQSPSKYMLSLPADYNP